MKPFVIFFVLLSLVLHSGVFAQPVEEIVVAGDPPITLAAVRSHIALMEFVLGVRLTTAQKNGFLQTIKDECAEMEPQDRKDFLQAHDLFQSMATMKPDQLDVIRGVLTKDYEESAGESDPASQLFQAVRGNAGKIIAQSGSATITLQALEAFAEYLEYSRAPSTPASLTALQKEQLLKSLTASFQNFPEPVKNALSSFDRKWHLIKTAIAGAEPAKTGIWKTAMFESWKKFPITAAFDDKLILSNVNPDLWREMMSFSAASGQTEDNWVGSLSSKVW